MSRLVHRAVRAALRVAPEPLRRGAARLPFSRLHRVTSTLMRGEEVIAWRGLRIRLDPGETIGYYTYLFGDYDRAEIDCLVALCRSARVVFDVGANQGWVSLAIARHCPGVHVVGFEPDAALARLNRASLDLNSSWHPHVTLREHAIGDSDADIAFARSRDENSGVGRLDADAGSRGLRVPCRTIDSVCRETGLFPDVVKIDIEGAELAALRGMTRLFEGRAPRAVVVELHGFTATDQAAFYRDIHDRLVDAGYTLSQIAHDRVRAADPWTDWPSRTHIVAVQPGVTLGS
jgi:FkbM family methyltransferase